MITAKQFIAENWSKYANNGGIEALMDAYAVEIGRQTYKNLAIRYIQVLNIAHKAKKGRSMTLREAINIIKRL